MLRSSLILPVSTRVSTSRSLKDDELERNLGRTNIQAHLLWKISALRIKDIVKRDMIQIGYMGHVHIGKLTKRQDHALSFPKAYCTFRILFAKNVGL